MNKPALYVNSKGYPVTRHSYSGGETFHFCARKYKLQRIQGWQEREQRSSKDFGIATENAIKFYHQRNQDVAGAVKVFDDIWDPIANKKDVTYSKSDVDWERLHLSGRELIRLYAVKYPDMPYTVSKPEQFQVEIYLDFPEPELMGIQFMSILDIVGELKATGEPLVIDMKTSGKALPQFIMLDPQLQTYSWASGYPNVSFLGIQKCGRKISCGDTVSMLETRDILTAGSEATVLGKSPMGDWVLAGDSRVYDEMGVRFKGTSAAVEAQRLTFITANGVPVPEKSFTKQRINFENVVVSHENAQDRGAAIKQDILNIIRATNNDFFPMEGGVRWPNDKCLNCEMRGICADNPKLRETLVKRKQLEEFEFISEAE